MSVGGSPSKKAKLSQAEQEDQEEIWLEIFRLFDRNGDGHVSSSEIGTLMRGLNMNPTKVDIDNAIRKVDANGTGQIEWEEFSQFLQHLKSQSGQEASQMEQMIRAFKLFDYNNDDHIDANELRRVVTSMGDKLTIDEANQMIEVADIDADGRINYKEFVKFINAPCL